MRGSLNGYVIGWRVFFENRVHGNLEARYFHRGDTLTHRRPANRYGSRSSVAVASSKLDPMSRLFARTDGPGFGERPADGPNWRCSRPGRRRQVLGHDRNTSGTRPRAVAAGRTSGEFIAGLPSKRGCPAPASTFTTPGPAAHPGRCLPLVADLDADFGVMISASRPHAGQRHQVLCSRRPEAPDDVEDAIEDRHRQLVQHGRRRRRPDPPRRRRRGPLHRPPARQPQPRLDDLKVVVDCAHGAASLAAPVPRAHRCQREIRRR